LWVTSLLDNNQSDQYFYEIIVFTGQRKDVETKSTVRLSQKSQVDFCFDKFDFILSGDDDETHIRTLSDPHRPILQGSVIDALK
jgi:hypothetical protein